MADPSPPPPTQALPSVVFLHGNSGCRVDAYDAVRVLLPLNITVFCLDLSGSGLSEGQYITLGVRESEDLRSVIAHLRTTGARTASSTSAPFSTSLLKPSRAAHAPASLFCARRRHSDDPHCHRSSHTRLVH